MWWIVHIEGGPRRVNHAAVAVGDRIYCFGGYCTGDNYKMKTPIDLFILNPHTYRWKEVPKPRTDSAEAEDWPYQRYGHTVCAHGTDIYLFGGRNDEAPCNVVYRFDTKTGTWSRPSVAGNIPPERDGHSACVINDSMYVFGGYEESHSRYGQEVYKLDLNEMVWYLVMCSGEQPRYRDFHTATAIGDRMYIYGGRSEGVGNWAGMNGTEVYSNKLSYLDTSTRTWHTPPFKGPVPKGRRSHSALELDGRLMIFGGYNGRSDEHMNDMWFFDPDTGEWEQARPYGRGPIPRRRQAMCLVGTRIYLFGGTSKYTGPPIGFTEEQQNNMQDTDEPYKLIDHNDLYVLDLRPSLRTLSMLAVMKSIEEENTAEGGPAPSTSADKRAVAVTRSYKIDMAKLLVVWEELPGEVRQEMRSMIENNTISRQLPLKLG